MTNATDEKIAIVGGGIAGLFCALSLAQNKRKAVYLFETSDRLGGRIRTIRLNSENEPLGKDWKANELEFYVEFGPMRIELDKQLLLKGLLTHLGIHAGEKAREDEAHLKDFPPYVSETSPHDPRYELNTDEVGQTPLQLLQMALFRVILNLEVDGESAFERKRAELVRQLTSPVTQAPVDRIFKKWMKGLNEGHYWEIQTRGHIAGVPLYAVGFWNLLSDYLSHNATTKLRDLGTFYHLLPENPNAAEWLVWWLLGFSISDNLQGIYGGMECIIDRLVDKVGDTKLFRNCWVKKLEKTSKNKLKLVFHDDPKNPKSQVESGIAEQEYDRVILALPKKALQDVARESTEAFAQEPDINGLLDSAFGFPMVKTFVVVKDRWWEEEHRPNLHANRIPTRELHYFKGKTEGSRQGLIMAYTDRPASSFWANYVPSGPQIDAHRSAEKPLPDGLEDRLVKKVIHYLNDNNLPDITPEDIVWYGIRDWGRLPYGGANHAWRPERKYWVVMRRLAEIPVGESAEDNSSIHICGEAYSDYHGFMEGSLRSAAYVLHRILDRKTDGTYEPLPWLREEDSSKADEEALCVKKDYLRSLRQWAANLDDVERGENYLHAE